MLDVSDLWNPYDELEDPYRTCEYGHHNWRLASQGEAEEDSEYVCTECGSTDPEGDSAK